MSENNYLCMLLDCRIMCSRNCIYMRYVAITFSMFGCTKSNITALVYLRTAFSFTVKKLFIFVLINDDIGGLLVFTAMCNYIFIINYTKQKRKANLLPNLVEIC